jgi:hypothetical protein
MTDAAGWTWNSWPGDGTGVSRDNGETLSVSSVSSVSGKDQLMHPALAHASGITHDVIGAAIGVHKDKEGGLLESSESTEKPETTELLYSVAFVVSC